MHRGMPRAACRDDETSFKKTRKRQSALSLSPIWEQKSNDIPGLRKNKRPFGAKTDAFSAFYAGFLADDRRGIPFLRQRADRAYPDGRAGVVLRAAVCFHNQVFLFEIRCICFIAFKKIGKITAHSGSLHNCSVCTCFIVPRIGMGFRDKITLAVIPAAGSTPTVSTRCRNLPEKAIVTPHLTRCRFDYILYNITNHLNYGYAYMPENIPARHLPAGPGRRSRRPPVSAEGDGCGRPAHGRHRPDESMGNRILTLDVKLSKQIQYLIESEGRQPGWKLPPERELSEKYGVQRSTLRAALQILIQKGVICCRERCGYYVAPARNVIDLNEYKASNAVILRMGKETHTQLLEFGQTEITERLGRKTMMPVGRRILHVHRLRYENDTPIALERSFILSELAGTLTRQDLQGNSLYAVLKEKFNICVAHSSQNVTVVYANALEAGLLGVDPEKPLMNYQGLVYDRNNRLIEYFKSIMRIEYYEFISRKW